MQSVDTPIKAIGLVQDFLMDRIAATPDDVRDKLKELVRPGFIAPLSCRAIAEMAFARRDELPEEFKLIAIQCTNQLIFYQQFSYQNGRGAGIVAGLQGETEGLPEPDETYLVGGSAYPRDEPEMPEGGLVVPPLEPLG